jgi:NADPH:quinone reductase-like Zn-dependent oxidoreductase
MKAAIYEKYGPPEVVRIADVPTPTAAAGEVLVRVRATTVESGDARLRASRVPWLFWLPLRMIQGMARPRPSRSILGTAFAGEVAAVGEGVTKFAPGDAVWGQQEMGGAHAELMRIKADAAISRMPGSLSFEEAAAIPFGAGTADHFLREVAGLRGGQKVAIIGASGAVGAYSVQIAKQLGAEVTAVCSAANADMVRALGADVVVDYRNEDYAARGVRYDVVMDCVGASSYARARRCLADGGKLLVVNGSAREVLWVIWTAMFHRRSRALLSVAMGTREGIEHLLELAEAGSLRPVIDRTFPFADIVEGHRLADSGRKRGAAVVTVP